MTIRAKLLVAFLAVIMIAGAQSLYSANNASRNAHVVSEIFEGPMMAVDAVRASRTSLREARSHVSSILAMTQPVDSVESLVTGDSAGEWIANHVSEELRDVGVVLGRTDPPRFPA